jgi:hypothetical protein
MIKKVIYVLIVIAMTLLALTSMANTQSQFEIQGKNIVSKSTRSGKSTATKTDFNWVDSKGQVYPVYMSSTGSCFIIRKSSKTGKEYISYLGPEISQTICNKLGVTYKSKKKS